MSKGIVGESGADRATDKMDKFISRSTWNNNKRPPKDLIESLQEMYPTTWKEVIRDMRREYSQGGSHVPKKQIVL